MTEDGSVSSRIRRRSEPVGFPLANASCGEADSKTQTATDRGDGEKEMQPPGRIVRLLHRNIRSQHSKALRDEGKVEGKLRLQKRNHDMEPISTQRLADRRVKVHVVQHVAQVPWPAVATSEKKEEGVQEMHRRNETTPPAAHGATRREGMQSRAMRLLEPPVLRHGCAQHVRGTLVTLVSLSTLFRVRRVTVV